MLVAKLLSYFPVAVRPYVSLMNIRLERKLNILSSCACMRLCWHFVHQRTYNQDRAGCMAIGVTATVAYLLPDTDHTIRAVVPADMHMVLIVSMLHRCAAS